MTTPAVPNHHAPKRIVPLHNPIVLEKPHAAAPAVPAVAAPVVPHLTYNNGPLLTAVQIFTVYWGAAWKQAAQITLAGQLNNFFKFIVTSPLIDQMGEYSVPGKKIGHGSFIGTTNLATPAPKKTTTDAQIQAMLQKQIATNHAFPKPTANTLYFVFLPPGVTSKLGNDLSCSVFCGYHDATPGNVFYAVMPYPDCTGCLSGTPFDSLTITSSHELCEAITDAVPGKGWYWFADQNHQGEIGDICEASTKKVGAFTVQKEWSNVAKACI
jgi:hypothetical protein